MFTERNAIMEGREDDVDSYSSRPLHSSTQSSSHHTASTPGRKISTSPCLRHRPLPNSFSLLIIIVLTCCLSLSTATRNIYIEESMIETDPEVVAELLGSTLDRLTRSGALIVDQSDPPPVPRNPKAWTLATENDDLQRRGLEDANQQASVSVSVVTSASTVTSTATSTVTTASSATPTSTGLSTATGDTTPSPLPSPFDQGFSGNITDSCSSFMYGFLDNSTFKSCLPFSLLLQNSNSFFQASKSVLRITQTLDATCAANVNTCTTLMNSLASNITASDNCASDLASQNPLIEQARLGLLAYNTLYTASCLRNPVTSSYCFADAVTNSSSPTDSYIYYLPLNISLPGGSQPTCDSCLKNTMAVFEQASSSRSSAIATDYVGAASQVNVQCGPGFVNASLAAAVQNSAPSSQTPTIPGVGVLVLAMLVGSWFL